MPERYKTLSAVYPIILNAKQEVLLARRQNTGYMDGYWDLAGSGHVDAEETATQALIREAQEELGLTLAPAQVQFAHVSHRIGTNGYRPYYDFYFWVKDLQAQPRIAEPEKCAALEWFAGTALPADMIPLRRQVLEICLAGTLYYSEFIIKS